MSSADIAQMFVDYDTWRDPGAGVASSPLLSNVHLKHHSDGHYSRRLKIFKILAGHVSDDRGVTPENDDHVLVPRGPQDREYDNDGDTRSDNDKHCRKRDGCKRRKQHRTGYERSHDCYGLKMLGKRRRLDEGAEKLSVALTKLAQRDDSEFMSSRAGEVAIAAVSRVLGADSAQFQYKPIVDVECSAIYYDDSTE